jgi:hypothetical protein
MATMILLSQHSRQASRGFSFTGRRSIDGSIRSFPNCWSKALTVNVLSIDRYLSRQHPGSMVGVFHCFKKLDCPDLFFGDLGVDHHHCRFEHDLGFAAVRDIVVLLDRS